jgi:hypothetical protein
MEALTRIVADSLARHGFDRPIDPRRLQWSRWSRCDSPHSLLVVPSKPGIFALAEEIMDLGPGDQSSKTHEETPALGCPAERSWAAAFTTTTAAMSTAREGHNFSRAVTPAKSSPALASGGIADGTHTASVVRRLLAVLQFSEDDDMAFTLDRMFTQINPMRARLSSGHCFLRFVVIEDESQRRTICSALNQWLLNSAEKATGLPADFQSSLELTTDRVGRTLLSDPAQSIPNPVHAEQPTPDSSYPAPYPDSGANKNLHCPFPLPSGF